MADIKGDQQVWYIRFLIRKQDQQKKANVNKVLAHKIHKPVIKNFKRRNLYAWFKDNIWTADLAKMT